LRRILSATFAEQLRTSRTHTNCHRLIRTGARRQALDGWSARCNGEQQSRLFDGVANRQTVTCTRPTCPKLPGEFAGKLMHVLRSTVAPPVLPGASVVLIVGCAISGADISRRRQYTTPPRGYQPAAVVLLTSAQNLSKVGPSTPSRQAQTCRRPAQRTHGRRDDHAWIIGKALRLRPCPIPITACMKSHPVVQFTVLASPRHGRQSKGAAATSRQIDGHTDLHRRRKPPDYDLIPHGHRYLLD